MRFADSTFPDDPFQMLWQHRGSDAVQSWMVDALGQTHSRQPIAAPHPGSGWELIGQGDHDRSGQSDYLWRNPATGENRIWLNNSASYLELFPVADPQWRIESWADFDGNGSLDILWRHQTLGNNHLWLMQADQVVSGLILPIVADMDWKIGGAGDFNQDGQADILWWHQRSGLNGIWHTRDGAFQSALFLETRSDQNWQVATVADLDGDRQADILWRKPESGENQAWFMQGHQRQSSLALPPETDQNWQFIGIAQPNADLPGPQPIRTADLSNPTLTNPGLLFSTSDAVDLAVRALSLSGLPPSPGAQVNAAVAWQVQWQGNIASQNTAPVKVSWYLSTDPTISRTDRFLIAQSIDNSSLQQTLQLPDATDPFWQRIWSTVEGTAYLGVLIEPIGATDSDRTNNQSAIALTITRPLLYEYDFTYRYGDSVTPSLTIDSYRGQVIAYQNTYQLDQVFDPNPAKTQSNQNGQYTITGLRPYTGLQPVGSVLVTEYFDGETGTRYQPRRPDKATAHGIKYLGSESGYIQARQSNTDRFGYDFYEADVWLTPPTNPTVSNAPRSTNLVVRSLLNPFLSYWDTSNNGGVITYSFYQPTANPYIGRETVSEVNGAVKRNVRQMFSQLETMLNVRFVEVDETDSQVGAIRYMVSDGEGELFYAYAYFPGNGTGGDVHLSAGPANDTEDGFASEMGSYGYRSLLHETLHALGLKHPGNYDASVGSGVPPFLPLADDHSLNTIMSYNIAGFYPTTPMTYDLQALEYLYGLREKAPGQTRYQFNSLTRYQVGQESFGTSTELTKQTIFDRSGIDTADFSQLAVVTNHWFDLRPGGIFTALTAYDTKLYQDRSTGKRYYTSDYGTSIAGNTVIENLVNSRGSDQIVANSASNEFLGYRLGVTVGNDVIYLADQTDRLVLQDYQLADLAVRQDQADLVLNLAGDGTVRLKDYFSQPGTIGIQVSGLTYRYDNKLGWQRWAAA